MKQFKVTLDKDNGLVNEFSRRYYNYITDIIDESPIVVLKSEHPEIGCFSFRYFDEYGNSYYMCCDDIDLVKDYIWYDNTYGIFKAGSFKKSYGKGDNNRYPYELFSKNYSAMFSLNLFENIKDMFVKESTSLQHSVGIEYESSKGYIPEYYCIHKGLVPLRDGSISGTEYATIPMSSKEVKNAIKNHCELFDEYCDFDKECSTHVHFGEIEINPVTIYCLYVLMHSLQGDLMKYIGSDIFHTSTYKRAEKDYCKLLPKFDNFKDFFNYLSMGEPYLGSLTEEHPEAVGRRGKWNITSRYHWVNFINMCFYAKGKTIEFRFLPATHNSAFLHNWVLILDHLIQHAIKASNQFSDKCSNNISYEDVLPYIENTIKKCLFKEMPYLKYRKASLFLDTVSKMYSIPEDGMSIPKVLLYPQFINHFEYKPIED